MACYPSEFVRVHPASTYERTAATMDLVLHECILPDSVNAGEPFDMKIVYKLCSIEEKNPDNMLVNFPDIYDGGWYREWGLYPFRRREYWIWRLVEMGLTLIENPPETMPYPMAPGEIKVDERARSQISPGDKLTYTYHGTIEQLLGREFANPTIVKLAWSVYGSIYGWYGTEYWPWSWPLETNHLDFSRACWIGHEIQVNILPPAPYPVFNANLCSVSKTTVGPNETFNIKVTIENQNETTGNYSIACYCEGNRSELAAGTIGGHATKSHTFSVTANQLANRSIASSQYLAFTITIANDEGETDRWTPAAIAVIVEEPAETATLSGRVTDKQTGLALAGVSVTAGYSTSTNYSGHYALEGLEPGSYDIKFSRAGYWDITKSKTLSAGENTLNITMTPTSEPEPTPSKFPLALMGVGAAGLIGVILIAKGIKKEGKK